jgi:hypothetical protein
MGGKIGLQSIKCARPATVHAGTGIAEGFAFGVVNACLVPADLETGLLFAFGDEVHHGQHFKGPCWCHGMAGHAALRIGEALPIDESTVRSDFLVGDLAPHLIAVIRLRAIVVDAAGFQILLGLNGLHSRRCEPLRHFLRTGAGAEQAVLRQGMAWRLR